MRPKSKTVEIGEEAHIDTETKKYLIHIRGSPALEALAIRDLIKKGWNQPTIAKAMKLSQSQISKRLSLFKLIPELFSRLKKGEIRSSTAFVLSKLPTERQKQYGSKKKITLKEVKEKRRDLTMSKELMNLLQAPINHPTENQTLPDPEKAGKTYRKKTLIFAVRMDHEFEVRTLEGTMRGNAGDYLAKGVKNELYPIAADIFAKTYEEVGT